MTGVELAAAGPGVSHDEWRAMPGRRRARRPHPDVAQLHASH